MAHLLCRNIIRKGFKKWETQTPLVYAVIIFCIVVGFCIYGWTNICSFSSSECKRTALALKADKYYFQQNINRNDISKLVKMMETSNSETRRLLGGTRRLLGGPGSSPPRCNSKCSRCVPCQPVHVTVPPGTPVTTEYYPEAWRCKCGNKLYMP